MGTIMPPEQYHSFAFGLAVSSDGIANMSYVRKFGHNTAVGTTLETLWSGSTVYTYPAAATSMNITSKSTDDVATTGTGAWTVTITGLDANYAEVDETVSLNGQNNVATTTEFLRVFRMVVRTAGSGGKNADIIHAGTGTNTLGVPANSYGQIPLGYNQSLMAIYTIPANKTAYLYEMDISSAVATQVESVVMVRPFGEVFQIKDMIDMRQDNSRSHWDFPLKITEKSDIEMQAKAGGGTGEISGNFTLLLVDN